MDVKIIICDLLWFLWSLQVDNKPQRWLTILDFDNEDTIVFYWNTMFYSFPMLIIDVYKENFLSQVFLNLDCLLKCFKKVDSMHVPKYDISVKVLVIFKELYWLHVVL